MQEPVGLRAGNSRAHFELFVQVTRHMFVAIVAVMFGYFVTVI